MGMLAPAPDFLFFKSINAAAPTITRDPTIVPTAMPAIVPLLSPLEPSEEDEDEVMVAAVDEAVSVESKVSAVTLKQGT